MITPVFNCQILAMINGISNRKEKANKRFNNLFIMLNKAKRICLNTLMKL